MNTTAVLSGKILPNAVSQCGLITPETKTQAGLRTLTSDNHYRLFFGDQTASEVEQLQAHDQVKVKGYIKDNDYGAIFVTSIASI